jgi:hypothetical protein
VGLWTGLGEVEPEHMCTGAQAIMPAHKLGAGKMVLLGFDNKPGHWATSLRKHYAYPLLPDPEVFDAYGLWCTDPRCVG